MRKVWAVATNTIRQALRMKVAAIFIVLLLVLLPVMGSTATGDGTLKGRLQTFVSYGLSLTSLLLSLLTIIVSIYSITSDIEHRQIYTVVTKPIRRYQLILGKFLGVCQGRPRTAGAVAHRSRPLWKSMRMRSYLVFVR